ncbi:MAG: hypothetical protein AAGF99_00025 [Bacteroidota bacterium]
MAPRTLRHPAFYYAVPALLVLIAGWQIYRAHMQYLTPWKGGGFGMFSTVDGPTNRVLRTYLVTPEGEALALYGTLSVQKKRILGMPDDRTLEQIGREAAAEGWAIYPFDEVLDEIASLPEDLRRYLAQTPAMERRRQERRREKALARADSTGEPPDSALIAVDTTALVPYPTRVAFAQPRPRPPGTVEPEILQVRTEVWGMRYDPDRRWATPYLLNSVTLDLD